LFRIVINIKRPNNALKPCIKHCYNIKVSHDKNIDEQQNKEFSVPESDAVVDPKTVVIHV
jgi:hypothetical protein